MIVQAAPQGVRQFSMAFNIKSRFEEAFEKKNAAATASAGLHKGYVQ